MQQIRGKGKRNKRNQSTKDSNENWKKESLTEDTNKIVKISYINNATKHKPVRFNF